MLADGFAYFAGAKFFSQGIFVGCFIAVAGAVGGDCEPDGANGDSLREPK